MLNYYKLIISKLKPHQTLIQHLLNHALLAGSARNLATVFEFIQHCIRMGHHHVACLFMRGPMGNLTSPRAVPLMLAPRATMGRFAATIRNHRVVFPSGIVTMLLSLSMISF